MELSESYSAARTAAGKAKAELETYLTANLKDIRSRKANVGYDLAILMLCEEHEEAGKARDIYTRETHRYKGLEKLIEAHKSRIMLEMAIMKFIKEGGG